MFATSRTTPLTTFHDNSVELIDRLKATHRAITLTIDGKLKAILQDVAESQRQLDLPAIADATEGIRQCLANVGAG